MPSILGNAVALSAVGLLVAACARNLRRDAKGGGCGGCAGCRGGCGACPHCAGADGKTARPGFDGNAARQS
jgi:hypothetical protein